MWSTNSPQMQTPALLILPLFGCLCGPTFASRTPRRRRLWHCGYYLNLAVYVVPRLPIELPADADPVYADPRLPMELPADADPGNVDITSIWLFMWSHVCQLNSPQTPALVHITSIWLFKWSHVCLPADADPGIVDSTSIWLIMWSHVCQSNSPQTQTPLLLILTQFSCLCGPTFASGTPRRRRLRHCGYYLNLAVYVVPRLPIELPADADPGIVDVTSIWLFMWSHVCQLNSPQTQTLAMLILPQFGCLYGPTFANRTPRRRRLRHCWSEHTGLQVFKHVKRVMPWHTQVS